MTTVRNLFKVLQKTSGSISNAFRNLVKKRVTPETLESLENTLLAADMGVSTVEEVIKLVEKNQQRDFLKEVEQFLISCLSEIDLKLINPPGPFIHLVVGVNGTGKTTSAAKLANYYRKQGKNVLLIGADTYRAAAVDQLKKWADRLTINLICNEQSHQPSALLFDGLTAARAQKTDVAIVDTAGRLHTYINLMMELEKMIRVVEQHFSDFKIQPLLTLDAGVGQNSLIQAREFAHHVPLKGTILTKMDGTAKGGIVFPLIRELNLPTRFIGVGETLNDLYPFDPEDYVRSLLGTT
ncbi:MAG: signal recognition particle-docking protein FtsY [Fidelibacterota bacterium]